MDTNENERLREENRKLLLALQELMSIVKIHSEATGANFAWAEMAHAQEVIAGRTPTANGVAGQDMARLNWLEQSSLTFCGNYTGSGFRVIGSGIWYGTLREAIDGAMQDTPAAGRHELRKREPTIKPEVT